ncbi:hypothetical protein GJ744_002094 [Endocarpon pusillum]|uniref:Uncharacterized protein n=1 Tax=Endocarpon pusillum TaxID=364733 RepID=A0A8H7E1E3_9EURO|nr:hypothetical protein GJ744_002094 [Endocarpon pusillum]
MLEIVSAMTDSREVWFAKLGSLMAQSVSLTTLNEPVLLSQDECIFEDLEVVLGALDGENDVSDEDAGHASNEDEETEGY